MRYLIYVAPLALLFSIEGCAIPGVYSGMSAKELEAMSKIKDAAVICVQGSGPPLTGQGALVFASVDKGVCATITVKANCETSIDNSCKKP